LTRGEVEDFRVFETLVMLVPGEDGFGPAYTELEWVTMTAADWEFADGWFFRGQSMPPGWERVYVRPYRPDPGEELQWSVQ
jgi:hypothetical protein